MLKWARIEPKVRDLIRRGNMGRIDGLNVKKFGKRRKGLISTIT